MKNQHFLILLLCTFVYIMGCKPATDETTADREASTATETAEPAGMTKSDSIELGRYLVTVMGCHDCHTPKIFTNAGEMLLDSSRLLSGHPGGPAPTLAKKSSTMPQEGLVFSGDLTRYTGPWGTSFSANLTPDVTGTGSWTFENFKKAVTEGKFKGLDNGRPIMPPMPWDMFRHAKPEHLGAIWAYIQSLPPISNKVPDYIPPGK